MLKKFLKILLVFAIIVVFGIIGSNDFNDKLEEAGISKSK